MRTLMEKILEYNGYKISIIIELRCKTERCIDGKSWHKVEVDCPQLNYHYDFEFEATKDIKQDVGSIEYKIKDFVDSQTSISDSEKILNELGYKTHKIISNENKAI